MNHLLRLLAVLFVLLPASSEAFFLQGGSAASSAGGAGLLTLPSDAMFIYSAAQQQGYTGSSVRLRRSSDNAEQDFGWVNGRMDTASMDTFCASTTCFYSVAAYDQSGNGNHCAQTTAANQPQYSPAAAVNGYPGVTWFTATARCNIPSNVTASRQAVTVLSVDAVQATAGTTTLMGLDTTSGNRFAFELRSVGTTLQNNTAFLNSTWMANAQMQFKAVTSSPTETRIYLNNRQSSALAVSTDVTLTGGYWGRTDTGGYTYYGNAYLLAGYARTFTQSQVNAESAKLYPIFGINPSNTKRVYFEGDSITWGQGSSVGVGYPRRVNALFPSPADVDIQNSGDPGKRLTAINAGKAFSLVYSYRSDYAKNIVSVFAGTNDLTLDGVDPTTLFNNQLVPYVQQAFSTGYNAVLVGTMLKRSDCTATCETNRVAWNNLITTNASTYGYIVVNTAGISCFQDTNDACFSGDHIHPSDSGYQALASLFYSAILPTLAANDNISPNLFAANDNWAWSPRRAVGY